MERTLQPCTDLMSTKSVSIFKLGTCRYKPSYLILQDQYQYLISTAGALSFSSPVLLLRYLCVLIDPMLKLWMAGGMMNSFAEWGIGQSCSLCWPTRIYSWERYEYLSFPLSYGKYLNRLDLQPVKEKETLNSKRVRLLQAILTKAPNLAMATVHVLPPMTALRDTWSRFLDW